VEDLDEASLKKILTDRRKRERSREAISAGFRDGEHTSDLRDEAIGAVARKAIRAQDRLHAACVPFSKAFVATLFDLADWKARRGRDSAKWSRGRLVPYIYAVVPTAPSTTETSARRVIAVPRQADLALFKQSGMPAFGARACVCAGVSTEFSPIWRRHFRGDLTTPMSDSHLMLSAMKNLV